MITKPRVSLEAFLAMEETKPYLELIDGEVVEKPMPGLAHGKIVFRLAYFFTAYLERTREGVVVGEVRHLDAASGRVYLPDAEVIVGQHAHAGTIVEYPPNLAIEVLSPDSHPGRVTEKIDFYLRAGVQLTWLVDPDTQTIAVYRPDRAPELFRRGQVIDAKPVLSTFSLDLEALFSILDEPTEGDEPA